MKVQSADEYWSLPPTQPTNWSKLCQRACFEMQHPQEEVLLKEDYEDPGPVPVRFSDMLAVMARRGLN